MRHNVLLGGKARQVGAILVQDDGDGFDAYRIDRRQIHATPARQRVPPRIFSALFERVRYSDGAAARPRGSDQSAPWPPAAGGFRGQSPAAVPRSLQTSSALAAA
jgi:hypothetical protein